MGGLAGHMSHLYDNPRLTFSKIKSILQDAAEGKLEGTEKTDGQNLYISFSVPDQELEFTEGSAKAARNKTNIKSGGMSIRQLANKFSFNKSLKKSFSQALRDFENVIKSFPRSKQEEIFGPDTNIYYNAEIINPETANVINYDSKLVSIHRGGGAEFDKETGSAVEVEITDPETGEVITGPRDVSRHAKVLADELDKIQQDLAGNKFKIEMDAVFNLKALEDKEALNTALRDIESEISSEGISDSQMVIEYIMARILSMIRERGMELDEETESLLLKRVLLSNPAYRSAYGYDRMPKELDPRRIVKNASPRDKNSAIYIIKNADQILKAAIEPIETTIHDFSVEMLKGLESLFILDNKKEAERLRKEVSKAIRAIEGSGHEDALEILQKQMSKLKSVENISTAAEGFVFDHDGWTYKFTGNFAPINQILGLFKYGRSGIPPLEQLNEQIEEEAKRVVVVWPGRFQPMGAHHYKVFEKLQEEHGSDNVYIATSDAKTNQKSPLNFEEKKKIMLKHGVPEDKILKTRRMYRAEELEDVFSADDDILVFVVGKKDQERLSSDHYSSYEKNKENLQTFDNKVYLKIMPHVSITLPDGEEMSGTTLRNAMLNLTPEAFKQVMGWFDKDIYEMLQDKIKNRQESLSEAIFSIINEVISERSKASKDRVSKKISYLIDKEKKDPKQAAAIAYSMEDRGELGERTINYDAGPAPEPKPKRKKKQNYKEPALQDDYDTGNSKTQRDDIEFDELDEISSMAGSSVGGYSLPLGQKPKYFKNSKTKVKDPNVYNRKRKNK
tara:strand:+ start:390 stop:2759 length:2370 start_codon:yes stop_codon:yes gene_type:complete